MSLVGLSSHVHRWYGHTVRLYAHMVVYFFIPDTTEVHQIQMSINQLMEDTGHCITFIPRTYQDDFVFITGNIRG